MWMMKYEVERFVVSSNYQIRYGRRARATEKRK